MAEENEARKAVAESLRRLETLLGSLPSDSARDLKNRIANLRSLMVEQRPPALALVGRRGAGKSSLLNALVGEKVAELGHVRGQTGRGRWFDVTTDRGSLSILDTRGVQEGSKPAEDDDARTPLASILNELEKKAPDIIVFVVRATDVDSAIDGDLDALEQVLRAIERTHKVMPPVLGVITHADMLEPKSVQLHKQSKDFARSEVRDPPSGENKENGSLDADREEKMSHVRLSERTLEDKIRSRGPIAPHMKHVICVSTYFSFRGDGTLRADERWRMKELGEKLFEHLPNEGKAAFARLSQARALQDSIAKDLTNATATLCAGVAALPVPIADVLTLTTLQSGLVASIAYLSGRKMEKRTATEFFGALGMNLGAAFALREAARALIKYVAPGAGSVISAGVAFTGTMALGAAARSYFVWDEPIEKAKKIFVDRKSEDDRDQRNR